MTSTIASPASVTKVASSSLSLFLSTVLTIAVSNPTPAILNIMSTPIFLLQASASMTAMPTSTPSFAASFPVVEYFFTAISRVGANSARYRLNSVN